jgi:hypothetical protein
MLLRAQDADILVAGLCDERDLLRVRACKGRPERRAKEWGDVKSERPQEGAAQTLEHRR